MNSRKKAIELELTGDSQEIVNRLVAITNGKIPIIKVIDFLEENALATLDGFSYVWSGPLVDVAKHPETPSLLSAGLTSLFKHLARRDSVSIDTTSPAYAVQTLQMLTVLLQMQLVTENQVSAFYNLDGGRPFANLTVEQYLLDKDAYEADEAAKELAIVRSAKINQWRNRVTSAVVEWDGGFVMEAVNELRDVAGEMESF